MRDVPHDAVTGSLVLRQSDFGMPPYSALGDLLVVQDEIVIDFNLKSAATPR